MKSSGKGKLRGENERWDGRPHQAFVSINALSRGTRIRSVSLSLRPGDTPARPPWPISSFVPSDEVSVCEERRARARTQEGLEEDETEEENRGLYQRIGCQGAPGQK